MYTTIPYKETIIVYREPFPLSFIADKENLEKLPLSFKKKKKEREIPCLGWHLVSRKLICPLSNGIWTSVSRGYSESKSFKILFASFSIQKSITVELLLLVLLKSFNKYACQYLWERLVIFLFQKKQEYISSN